MIKKTKGVTLLLETILISFVFNLYASTPRPGTQPHKGNFSLPISQQPGPLISFGQNIIQKNQLQVYLFPNYLSEPNQYYLTVAPALVYGLSDKASLFLTFPVAADYVFNTQHSSGYGDTGVQGEYAFYNHDTYQYSDQATIVGGITLPTGSPYKRPMVGLGSASYFIGGTYNHLTVDWMFFTSPGALLLKPAPNLKFSTQYLYQAGIGRNIKSIPDKYIFFALLELDGQYSKNRIRFDAIDSNLSGNILLATPSLWISTKQFIAQLGIGFPVTKRWINPQNNIQYYASATLTWTIR